MPYHIATANGRGKCKRCPEKIPVDSSQMIYVNGEYCAYSYRYCKKCSEVILKDEIEHLQGLLDKLSSGVINEKEMTNGMLNS